MEILLLPMIKRYFTALSVWGGRKQRVLLRFFFSLIFRSVGKRQEGEKKAKRRKEFYCF